jgi:formylglycine-generating enzyme required for sulfatase activity
VGAIAHWGADEGAGSLGHVAYVEAVHPDGSVSVSEYNFSTAHEFGVRCGIRAPRYIHVVGDVESIAPPTSGMAYIPAGNFQMGAEPGVAGETVYVPSFYIGRTEVTYAQWQEVYNWAIMNGYSFNNAGSGKGANHPVHSVSWYDVVKWCNAASERAGRSPVYRTGDGSVYRTGWISPAIDTGNSGYRLPSSAEWEKAARGGLTGRRFPWGDTISHSKANYYGRPASYSYDMGPSGFHPDYVDGGYPYSSPVGSFSANGYGLYDVAGNMWEWCNDSSGSIRVSRGGSWYFLAYSCRVALRSSFYPSGSGIHFGFRLARSQ